MKKKIILSTPNGYISRDARTNPYGIHKSGWSINELKSLGFGRFRGVGGLRAIAGTHSNQFSFAAKQSLAQKASYFFAERANGLICVMIIKD